MAITPSSEGPALQEAPKEAISESFNEGVPGSVYINNTSYSGADIQLVLHIYEPNKTYKNRKDELVDGLENTALALVTNESELSKVRTKYLNAKTGTPAFQRWSTKYQKLTAQQTHLQNKMIAFEAEIGRLQKNDSNFSTQVLATLQTISISTNRAKNPVRTCGRTYPVGYTRGQRDLAGTMVFTVFNESVLYQFLEAHPSDFDANAYTSALLDQLPPMDFTLQFANEYGQISRMGIYGVEFVSEGATMSIEDILTENVLHFVARDFDPMRAVKSRKMDEGSRLMSDWVGIRASDLMLEDDYQDVKTALDPFVRFNRRRNPFL